MILHLVFLLYLSASHSVSLIYENRTLVGNLICDSNVFLTTVKNWVAKNRILVGADCQSCRFRTSVGQPKQELLITLTRSISEQLLSDPLTRCLVPPAVMRVLNESRRDKREWMLALSATETPSHRFIGFFSQFQGPYLTKVFFHTSASKKLPAMSRKRDESLKSSLNYWNTRKS